MSTCLVSAVLSGFSLAPRSEQKSHCQTPAPNQKQGVTATCRDNPTVTPALCRISSLQLYQKWKVESLFWQLRSVPVPLLRLPSLAIASGASHVDVGLCQARYDPIQVPHHHHNKGATASGNSEHSTSLCSLNCCGSSNGVSIRVQAGGNTVVTTPEIRRS